MPGCHYAVVPNIVPGDPQVVCFLAPDKRGLSGVKTLDWGMALADTESLLRRFARGELRQPGGPGVTLALRGRWGVGKTYLWDRVVREAASAGELGRPRYAYVSLFGLTSLDEVKAEVVASRRSADDLDPYADEGSAVKAARWAKRRLSPYLRHLKDHPTLTAALGPSVAGAVAFDWFGRNALVCFDDLERRGAGLDLGDVFGLATQLRDERGGDVLFIMNDGRLGDAATAYATHGEKAIDVQVRFSPTPAERFGLVFAEGCPNRDLVRDSCVKLRISNVRTLQRIDRALREVDPWLAGHRAETVEEAVRIVVLLVWAYHDVDGDAPPYDRVRLGKKSGRGDDLALLLAPDKEATGEDRALAELWKRYGPVDGGLALFEVGGFVERGWLDGEALDRHLSRRDEDAVKREGRASFEAAWDLFHAGFGDNADELTQAFANALQKHGARVSLKEAGNAIGLVRELGADDLADAMVERYMRHCRRFLRHGDKLHVTRIETLNDPVLERRVREVVRQRDDRTTLAEAMKDVSEGDSWGGDSSEAIRAATAEEIEAYLRTADVGESQRAVRWCLRGEGRGDTGLDGLAEKTRAALGRIAQSSHIDHVRVRSWFGIDPLAGLPPTPSPDDA